MSRFLFNLLRRLRLYAGTALLFTRDPTVPFTNTLGERAIRMPKVTQKISGSFLTFRTRKTSTHYANKVTACSPSCVEPSPEIRFNSPSVKQSEINIDFCHYFPQSDMLYKLVFQ